MRTKISWPSIFENSSRSNILNPSVIFAGFKPVKPVSLMSWLSNIYCPFCTEYCNSRKPSNELHEAFKTQFPYLAHSTADPSSLSVSPEVWSRPAKAVLTETITTAKSQSDHTSDEKHNNICNSNYWTLTPSILDVQNFGLGHLADHGSKNLPLLEASLGDTFCNSAGYLSTPNFGLQLDTPVTSEKNDQYDLPNYPLYHHHDDLLKTYNSLNEERYFAPSAFVHHDSDQIDSSTKEKCISPCYLSILEAPTRRSSFRFSATLNTPTSMIRDSNEAPTTYLNKGQAYSISINDTLAQSMRPVPPRYRTIIRISFENKEQRQRPGPLWHSWKEGKGMAGAHQGVSRAQAVEFVQGSFLDAESAEDRCQIDLEMASFDSFVVNWSPGTGSTDCKIGIRFNFLSTDFSYSKGVKGIPVRLCTKTQLVSPSTSELVKEPAAVVSYCKVKLFRDHGAERKLSNDVAHIKKMIAKVHQQINWVKTGSKGGSKCKRFKSKPVSRRPSKVSKHSLAGDVSSEDSNDHLPIDDLGTELATLCEMLNSTQPVSVLNLRGEAQDDPDAYPVLCSSEPVSQPKGKNSKPSASWDGPKRINENMPKANTSPALVTQPVPTLGQIQTCPSDAALQRLVAHDNSQQYVLSGSTTWVDRLATDGNISNWIRVSGIDPTYKPPPDMSRKPVACLYVKLKNSTRTVDHDQYTAVYLMERTRDSLIEKICVKFGVDLNVIAHAFRVNSEGLKTLIDDEVVRQIPEGLDLIVEFNESSIKFPIIPVRSSTASITSLNQDLDIRLCY